MADAGEQWITVESTLEKVEDTVEEILCRVDGNTLPNEKLFGFRLALHEALTNAIVHGNHNDPAKSVSIGYRRTRDSAQVTIRDQGSGFDCTSIPDPTHEDNLLQCSGRGIFLMRRLVDDVQYNKDGNQVTLTVESG